MNFEMTGKLSISKDTEKFHPYSETKYEKSGWVRRRLLFNVTCGDSRHMLTVDAGSFEDGHGDVYTYSKPEYACFVSINASSSASALYRKL